LPIEDKVTAIIEMKFLDSGCLAEILQLQDLVADNLPCKEIFILHEEKYFKKVLSLDRSALGVFAGEQLIAFSIIRIPGLSSENLGRDINLQEKELGGVAHLQAAAVHPAHRGRGLQRKLILAHLDVIEDMGYDHACCTVSPKNPVSLGNYLSCGLAIEGLCPKKHGWWRFILHKKIERKGGTGHRNASDMQNGANMQERANMMNEWDMKESCPQRMKSWVPILDIEGQLDLIKRGYKGFKITIKPEGVQAFYGKI
jgi:ribosomal protein S18 acetylase RimI-like enzyme